MTAFMNYNQYAVVSPGALGGSLAQVSAISSVAVEQGVTVKVQATVQLSGVPGSQVNLSLVESGSSTTISNQECILPDTASGTAILTQTIVGIYTVPGTPGMGTVSISWQLLASTGGTCSIGASSSILHAYGLV